MKAVLPLAIMAGCLIFTGWTIANIQHRSAAHPAPVQEVAQDHWLLAINTTKKKGAKS